MKYPAFKFAATITSLLLVAGLVGQLLFNSKPPPEEVAEAVLGNARNLKIVYQQWITQAKQNGADRNLVLALSYIKGLSAESTKAHGQVRLDLTDGTLSAEVNGLPNQDAFDLWLVDNGESSVKPEPGDAMIRIDRFQHEGASAKLRTSLGPEVLKNFKLDLVVVARAGKGPGEAGILFGSPSFFQRLYYSEQGGQLIGLADFDESSGPGTENQSPLWAPFSVLIPSPAYAADTADAALARAVANGERVFSKEQFNGNGRTCATCHRSERNLTIDPKFIATLHRHDPLFVGEFFEDGDGNDTNNIRCTDPVKSLGCKFEHPKLMRKFGLILENVDGMDNLEKKFVMRSVPHALALNTSLQPATSGLPEMIGWSADGSPTNTLRGFAIGAVKQHFTKTLDRNPGTDFRLPTEAELDAMEAFQLSLGRQRDLDLKTLMLNNKRAIKGQSIFINGNGKPAPFDGTCMACHNNAGATTRFGSLANSNFNTGVEDRRDSRTVRAIIDAGIPRDGGFGNSVTDPTGCIAPSSHCGFGDGTFNTPPLVEAADTAPFNHNNTFDTLEEAVEHYTTDQFNNLRTSGKFDLGDAEVAEVAAFLRVINVLENYRLAKELLNRVTRNGEKGHVGLARSEINDAIRVLTQQRLHSADALPALKAALGFCNNALSATTKAVLNNNIDLALQELEVACDFMGNTCP